MTHRIGTASDFLKGRAVLTSAGLSLWPKERHYYRARAEGRGIIIERPDGSRVKATFAGTNDRRTLYAHIPGEGFIGGWTYPHAALPWLKLVDYINMGVLYHSLDQLPKQKRFTMVRCADDPAEQYGPYRIGAASAIKDALEQATGRRFAIVNSEA